MCSRHLVALAFLFLAGCHARNSATSTITQPTPGQEHMGWISIVEDGVPTTDLLKVKPSELPAHVRSLYRLKPDRRFLYAIGEIDRIVSGERKGSSLHLQLLRNSWRICWNDTEVGSLPEVPTYTQQRSLLIDWAKRRMSVLGPFGGSVGIPGANDEASLSQGTPDKVFEALDLLNRSFKKEPKSLAILVAAARGFSWLVLQSVDDLQLTDPLCGRALALLAIVHSQAPSSLVAEEALLCEHLGYEAEARELAEQLPPTEPARLYVVDDLNGLRSSAIAPGADRRAQFLYLLRLADRREVSVWRSAFSSMAWRGSGDIPSIASAKRLADIGLEEVIPSALEAAVVLDLTQSPAKSGARNGLIRSGLA